MDGEKTIKVKNLATEQLSVFGPLGGIKERERHWRRLGNLIIGMGPNRTAFTRVKRLFSSV